MVKSQTITIKIEDVEVELNSELIDRYRATTKKKRVTKHGIEKFYNKLIEVMSRYPQ